MKQFHARAEQHRTDLSNEAIDPAPLNVDRRRTDLAPGWRLRRGPHDSRIPHPYSEQQARQWIGESGAGEFVRGIAVRSELIGCCGYLPIEEEADPQHDHPIAEIGYWLGKPYWGQGFATEAATALIDVCHQHGFKTILAGHYHDNPASGVILKKLGFQQTGQEHRWGEARNKLDLAVRYILRTK